MSRLNLHFSVIFLTILISACGLKQPTLSEPSIQITYPWDGTIIQESSDLQKLPVYGTCSSANSSVIQIQVDEKSDLISSPQKKITCQGGAFSGELDTSGLKTGVHTLSASISDGEFIILSTHVNLLKYSSGLPHSSIQAIPFSMIANDQSTATISVRLKDSSSQPLAGKVVLLASSRGSYDTILPETTITDSSGFAQFFIRSQYWGQALLTASNMTDFVTLSQPGMVQFLAATPLADYEAIRFNGVTVGSHSSTLGNLTTWMNLSAPGSSDGNLSLGFQFGNSEGWVGTGSSTSPYQLALLSTHQDRVSFGNRLNNLTELSFEVSVSPHSSSTPGSVILSNADEFNEGLTLRQSIDGQGHVELISGSSLTYADTLLNDSPLAYYRLGDLSSSPKITDSSGNHLSGINHGAQLGRSGSLIQDSDPSAYFDGLSSMIQTGAVFQGSTELSVEAWFKIDVGEQGGMVYTGDANFISSATPTPSSVSNLLYVDSDGYLRGYFNNPSISPLTSQTRVNNNTWHHAALTASNLSSNTQILYLDGVSVSNFTSLTPSSLGSTYTYLGTGYLNSHLFPFTGNLDEVAFYNKVLSPDQVLNHFQARSLASCVSKTTLLNQQFYLLTGVFNSSDSMLTLFVNGNQECQMTTTRTLGGSAAPLVLGAHIPSSTISTASHFFSGSISHLRIYDSVMDANQVYTNYQAFNDPYATYPVYFSPSVEMSSPMNETLFQSSDLSSPIQVTGLCHSSSTSSIRLFIDGKIASQKTPTALCMGQTFTTLLSLSGLSQGSHQLSAVLSDGINFATSAPVTLNITSTPPSLRLSVSGFPSPQPVGIDGNIQITARDSSGFILSSYTGAVLISSSDPAFHSLQYTFTPSDQGVKSFSVALSTPGNQSITVRDISAGTQATQSNIEVQSLWRAQFTFEGESNTRYAFDPTLLGMTRSGTAQNLPTIQTHSNLFSGSTVGQNGISPSNDHQSVSLSGTNTTNLSELESSWTPQYSHLVQYWKLNGSLGPQPLRTGSLLSATVGNNGVVSNLDGRGIHFDLGHLSSALSFDGVDDSISASPTLSVKGSFTVALWVKPTLFNSSNSISSASLFSTKQTNLPSFELKLLSSLNKAFFSADIGDGTSTLVTSATSSQVTLNQPNTWSHVVYSVSSTRYTAYLNNQVIETGRFNPTSPLLYNQSPIILGNSSTNEPFKGFIDEVAVWDISLSAPEINTLYSRQSALYSGSFQSAIMDVGSNAALNHISWNSFSWISTLPFFKELTSNNYSESLTDYTQIASSNLMDQNIGLWHLNETNGSTAYDYSGYNHHGSIQSTAVTLGVPGVFNTAMNFTRSPQAYIQIPNADTLTLSDEMTLTAWIYPNDYDSSIEVIGKTGTTYKNRPAPFDFYIRTDQKAYFLVGDGEEYATLQSKSTIPSGVWSFLAVTLNHQTATFYLNGVTDQSAVLNVSATDLGNPIYIGARPDGASANARFDEMSLWKRALSSSEISQIYLRGANRVKFQIRSCSIPSCLDQNWLGPDGTSQSYFSELNNIYTGALNAMTTAWLPQFNLLNFPKLTIPNRRYFQYRGIFESDDSHSLTKPNLVKVSVGPSHYNSSGSTLSNLLGIPFSRISSMSETLGPNGCESGIYYQISNDHSHWYYISQNQWTLSYSNTDWTQATPASVLNSYLPSFSTQVGQGQLYFRAFLTSNGITACELNQITFSGNR